MVGNQANHTNHFARLPPEKLCFRHATHSAALFLDFIQNIPGVENASEAASRRKSLQRVLSLNFEPELTVLKEVSMNSLIPTAQREAELAIRPAWTSAFGIGLP